MRTNFQDIRFNETNHTYALNGQQLDNVTKIIKRFQLPFDRDGQAARTAAKQGRSVTSILNEWDAKGEAARQLGTKVHNHIQQVLTRQMAQADPFISMNHLTPEEKAFNTLWADLQHRVTPTQVEWVIGDVELNLAGTVDTLFFSKDTGQHHLWDWKTGKFDVHNPFQKLLPPFSHLSDCKLAYYSLQLSLYKLIIERNTTLTLGDSYIVHLGPDGQHKGHLALDLSDLLKSAL